MTSADGTSQPPSREEFEELQASYVLLAGRIDALCRLVPQLMSARRTPAAPAGTVPSPVSAPPEPMSARQRADMLWHMTG